MAEVTSEFEAGRRSLDRRIEAFGRKLDLGDHEARFCTSEWIRVHCGCRAV
jgi:hypothetical protein